MSHHSGSELGQKDLTKSMTEATLISGSDAKIDASNAALNVAAGNNGNLNQGTIDITNFGLQTNTKHIEVNAIEHATITHHHHYGRDDKSEESPSISGTTRARSKRVAKKESSSTSRSTGARPKRAERKESPSTSGATRARPKRAAKKESSTSGSRESKRRNIETSATDEDGSIRKKKYPSFSSSIDKENLSAEERDSSEENEDVTEDGTTVKEKHSSSSSSMDEEDVLSDEEQEEFSNEDSSSSELNKKITEVVFKKGGGDITIKDSIINVAGRNIGSPSTPGTTGARHKRSVEKDCAKLPRSIWYFEKCRLAKRAHVFEGVKKNKMFPDQQLAIKLIWHYTEKNLREAENLCKLRTHTHVVAIVDTDVYKKIVGVKCLYIAMEMCNTLNLEDYIKERRSKNVPFNPNMAFEHAKQVIDAIDHIHGQNILHRDLKPSSVLFSLCGRYLKICDFGMSKKLENGRTVTGLSTLTVGTDGYRAPETYNKNDISKMADIFSLALVLYHLLSYGFHPFGIEPALWNFKIKRDQGFDLSRLRDPFLKIVKELLQKMLNFEPKDRLKIDRVKNSECMKLDWFPSIIESLDLIWNGAVKDHVGADMLSCRLYRSPNLQDVIEIDESGWKFQMKAVPYLDIGSLKKVTDEEPSGYIETSKDELKKLTDKLTGKNLLGWIDISKDRKESKVIVLLFEQGYPELFGFFLPDTNILTSLLASKQRLTSQEPAAAQSRNSSEPPRTETGFPRKPAQQDPTKDQEAASATDQWKQTSPGLIPWWIFAGDLQK